MNEPRVVILAREPYEGMERPGLSGVPEETLARARELEAARDVGGLRRLLVDLARDGVDGYDLVAIGGMPGSAWEFLGFDVGTPEPPVESLVHRTEPGSDGLIRNQYGIFWNQEDAQTFQQLIGEGEIVPIQRLRRSAIRPGDRIWYTIGNEFSPADPFGRIALTLDRDGAAELEFVSRGDFGHWQADVDPAVFEQIQSALARSTFPQLPPHEIPYGAAMRQIELVIDDNPVWTTVWAQFAMELDGYWEAFEALDSLAVQISSGAYRGAQDTLGPVVSNIRSVE